MWQKPAKRAKSRQEKEVLETVVPTPFRYIYYNIMYARKEVHLRFPLLDVERSDCAIVMLLHLL